jgi:segregation and condensation protein A
MDNGFSLACGMQCGFATKAAVGMPEHKQEKIVMISSHPDWNYPAEPAETPAGPVDLVRVFHEVLERTKRGPVLNMDDDPVTIGQMLDQAWRRLATEETPVRLSQMLRVARTERGAICLQLALLELLRLQAIVLRLEQRTFGDILMKKNANFDQVMNDTLAARDDWR